MAKEALIISPVKLVRRPNWQVRLTEYIVDSMREGIKCDWEFNHCAGWVAGAVDEMTGVNFFEPFEPFPIESAADAYMAIKRAGYESLEAYITTILVEKPLIFAKRGDVVFIKADGEEFAGLGMSQALGLADPPFFLALNSEGLGRGQLLDATRCFDIGGAS